MNAESQALGLVQARPQPRQAWRPAEWPRPLPGGPSSPHQGPLLFALAAGALSSGLGFAAVGIALYARGPIWQAAALFGAVGLLAGLACALLHARDQGLPAGPLAARLPADELASLVRATLAKASQARQASRAASVADRQPAPAAAPARRQFASSAFGA